MCFKIIERISRDLVVFFFHLTDSITMILSNPSSFLIPGSLLILVPAVLCGCSEEVHAPEPQNTKYIQGADYRTIYDLEQDSALDIFAFEDDIFRRLDSYQRIEDFSGDNTAISSTGGNKIFVLCLNIGRKRYEWTDIRSYSSLKGVFCNLESERCDSRSMSGEFIGAAGSVHASSILKPIACEVVLKSIGCDFSGTPYSQSVIEDVRVYLINVCATHPVLCDDDYRPSRYINMGLFNPDDVLNFKDECSIIQNVAEVIDINTIYPEVTLLCYPNSPDEDSPGSPCTRMVIEGKVDSQIYYWPVTVNGKEGIERGCRYTYDILIRRKGVTDPDTPIDPASVEINMRIKPWKEKEEYYVGF